ncbi:hypothetical protein AB0J80_38295 [Actinoplanes sp. NPDC049548]|uniref:hypothetical protein n=1 Tax=Actinoplanes sp. NPDC049548 TaxID=3155152 RepID=UPI00343B977B
MIIRVKEAGERVSTTDKSRTLRLVLAGTFALAAVAVFLWWWLTSTQNYKLQLPATEQAKLTATVLPIVESKLADTDSGERLACAIKILGTEPADARTADTVTTAYVQTLCATLDTAVRTESQQPAVVRLGTPAQVEVPGAAFYKERVQKLFPKRMQDAAFDAHNINQDAELEMRVKELAKPGKR